MNEALNLKQGDLAEARLAGERKAAGLVDGRQLRKRDKDQHLGFKVSAMKKMQLQRLAIFLGVSMTEVLEMALDDCEEKRIPKGSR